jgi:hypothetical protein
MDDEDLLITEEMLAKIAEYHQSINRHTFDFDRLELDKIHLLLIFPARSLLKLVTVIERANIRNLVSEGFRADAQEDFESFIAILNSFLDRLALLLGFDSPPLHEKALCGLFFGMTNFILLYQALYYHMKDGAKACVFEWVDPAILEDMAPTVRFPHMISTFWLAQTINMFDAYVAEHLEAIRAGEKRGEDLPFEISMAGPDDDTEEDDPASPTPMVAVHLPGQESYRLWARFRADGKVRFHFEPLWGDDENHLRNLLAILVTLEIAIGRMIFEIVTAWEHYSENLEEYALKDPHGIAKWLDELIESDRSLKASFDYKALRKSVMSLPWHVQTSYHIQEACNAYVEQYKAYLPQDVLKALRQADLEIDEILNATKTLFYPAEREERAMALMKRHPERFTVIIQDQVRHALKLYPSGSNRARNVRESILIDVARSFGRDISKSTLL